MGTLDGFWVVLGGGRVTLGRQSRRDAFKSVSACNEARGLMAAGMSLRHLSMWMA